MSWLPILLQHGAQSLYLKIWSAFKRGIITNKSATLTTNMNELKPHDMKPNDAHVQKALQSVWQTACQWQYIVNGHKLMLSFTYHGIQHINLDVFLSLHQYYAHGQLKQLLVILTCTLAPLRGLWDVWVGGSISSDRPVGDPGLVNTSFHPLHDEVQQDVHSLADVLSICSARLKIRDSAWRRMKLTTQVMTENCYQ